MKGKVWMLNVWASWCVSCRVEHPLLVEMSRSNVGADRRASTTRTSATTAMQWLAKFGNPYALSAFDVDGARRHRLRRLRRARDLRDRQAGRDPLQADRPDHARGAREDDPAARQEAERMRRFARRRCCSPSPALAFGQAAEVAQPDPAVEQRLKAPRRGAALPRVPEPDDRRFQRAARGRPAQPDPRADRAGPQRRRRSATTWSSATATSCSIARPSRRTRRCSGSARSR